MKPTILFTALVIALAGCSSTPTKVDTGPVKAATYNFVNGGVMPAASFAEPRQPIHALIQDAITRNLAAKGVSHAAGLGDITVAYLIITGNNATTTAINEYFGYGRDASALHDKAHDAYTGSKNPNYFEAGTLVIDLVDNRTHELLKRSIVTRSLLRNPPADVRQERIQEAVDAALASLRVAI